MRPPLTLIPTCLRKQNNSHVTKTPASSTMHCPMLKQVCASPQKPGRSCPASFNLHHCCKRSGKLTLKPCWHLESFAGQRQHKLRLAHDTRMQASPSPHETETKTHPCACCGWHAGSGPLPAPGLDTTALCTPSGSGLFTGSTSGPCQTSFSFRQVVKVGGLNGRKPQYLQPMVLCRPEALVGFLCLEFAYQA